MTFEETVARLFDRRILLSEEIIDDRSTGRLRVGFINLNLLDGVRPIRFYIDTRGGDVDEALRLVSTMQTIDAQIIGLVDGRCDILGLALLQACDVRLATRFSLFSIQRVSSSSSFDYAGSHLAAKYGAFGDHLERMQDKLDSVIVGAHESAELKKENLASLYEKKSALHADEVCEMGFIDAIVEKEGFWQGESMLSPGKIGYRT